MKMEALLFLVCLAVSACSPGGDPAKPPDAGTDPCQDVNCSGHGSCVMGPGGAACECEAGYHAEGLSCIEDGTTGPCFEVDCSGHGVCLDLGGTVECQCEAGYHADGLSCVEDGITDPCLDVTCSDHGVCVAANGVARCNCEEGYLADGLDCVETLCHCYERNQVHNAFCLYAQKCSTAADCCPDPASIAPYICNQDYPYQYACQDGHCESQTCTTNDHCQKYFQLTQESKPGTWIEEGCKAGDCPPYTRWCSIRRTCSTASNCCPSAESIAPYVCQTDSPYVYRCEDGFCRNVYCSQASHCQRMGQSFPEADGWVHLGCVDYTDPCTDQVWYGQCIFKQACAAFGDCCPENTGGLTCGSDYPYLYECQDSRCESRNCSSDAQCSAYFALLESSNPGKYANLGCVEY
jgi:hypothetical protein